MGLCPGLEILGTDPTIVDLLSYPSVCVSQFYAVVLAGLFIIIASILYFSDEERIPKSDFISAMGVASIATIALGLAGTLVGFIEQTIFIEILVPGIILVVIWFFKK